MSTVCDCGHIKADHRYGTKSCYHQGIDCKCEVFTKPTPDQPQANRPITVAKFYKDTPSRSNEPDDFEVFGDQPQADDLDATIDEAAKDGLSVGNYREVVIIKRVKLKSLITREREQAKREVLEATNKWLQGITIHDNRCNVVDAVRGYIDLQLATPNEPKEAE